MKHKICPICKTKFKPNWNSRKYCSKKCYLSQQKNMSKIYRKANKKEIQLYNKNYHKKYYKIHKIELKNYRINHRREHRNWERNKKKTDINYRISQNLGVRIYHALKHNVKSNFTKKLIGCSVEKLKKHLEKQFKPNMNWKNYGKWHIDHIKPCASFDLSKPKEQRKCFNYTNLQSLWAEENLKKGKNPCDCIMFPAEPSRNKHFAMFPTTLPTFCINAGCPEGGIVLDPFAGGGTTGVIALKLNRKFIGIELNQKYIDEIIIPRIKNTIIEHGTK